MISPWALYFTGWYDATLHSNFLHELMHVHLVVVGALFFTPIVGVDPVPGRVSYPFRLLLLMLTLPFHAFLGVTIMGQTDADRRRLVPLAARLDAVAAGPARRPAPRRRHPLGLRRPDRRCSLFGVLFVQWVRASMAEATREDRRLDRLERAAANASAADATPTTGERPGAANR